MTKMEGLKSFIMKAIRICSSKGILDSLDDKKYLSLIYYAYMGRRMNWKNPIRFSEKLQYLKIYDYNPIYTIMVDKYESKEYFKTIVNEKYIIPTIGIYNKWEEIPIDKLPNKFVIKTTHDSGGVVICKDKKIFDCEAAKEALNKRLKINYFYSCRETPYKDVKPRLIVEEYLDALETNGVIEYKIFCFNGEPKLFLVCKGTAHGTGRTNDFYDLDFNHIPVSATYPNASEVESKPEVYEELIEIAKKISKGIPQVRVDTYVVDGKVYIGEATFYHDGGFCRLKPEKYDLEFGKLIELPEKGK